MNPKISVIVPVYKAEKYLHRCVDSILAQTFTDFEVLLIDDGSPDKSGKICDEYAKIDNRIKVIKKVNGGANSARREGFVNSIGEYLVFLDSDDTLTYRALEVLYELIIQGYDVVKGSIERRNNIGKAIGVEKNRFSKGIIEGEEDIIRMIFSEDVAPYLCGSIYRRDLFSIDVFNKSIEAHISYGEDWITNLLIAKNIEKIICVEDVVYNYYVNTESFTCSQVVSLDYYNRQDKLLIQEGILDLPFLKSYVAARRHFIYVRSFFIPELNFAIDRYKEIRMEDSVDVNLLLRKKVDRKFLYFIDILPLYYLYSRLYCLLFYICKLSCKSRKILT